MKRHRFLMSLAVVATLCATGSSEANTVAIRGAPSCGVWVKARAQKQFPEVVNKAWLVGYLSGQAASQRSNFIDGTDNDSLFLWVDNFCRARPLDDLDDAGNALIGELKRRRGL